MTTPISFATMNRATTLEPADMAHVLGDADDAAWKGLSERCNDNFAAIKSWATQQTANINAMKVPAAELSGTGVLALASNWSLTDGWAYTRTLAIPTGKLVHLHFRLLYTGSTVYTVSNTNYVFNLTMATLTPGLWPKMASTFWRGYGGYVARNTAGDIIGQACAAITLDSAGVLKFYRGSYGTSFAKNSYVHATMFYYAGP